MVFHHFEKCRALEHRIPQGTVDYHSIYDQTKEDPNRFCYRVN
jgi:hypothetical protein